MCMAFNVQWNGARQITFPEEPPRWKQESSAGGRLWEGWSVIKGCRLGIAWQSRWAAGRTWELRNDSESGKPFSKIKPVTGSKWRHQKRRVSALEVRNLHLQLWHLLVRLVHQLSQHHLLPIRFQISGMQTCRHHNYLPVGVGVLLKHRLPGHRPECLHQEVWGSDLHVYQVCRNCAAGSTLWEPLSYSIFSPSSVLSSQAQLEVTSNPHLYSQTIRNSEELLSDLFSHFQPLT